MGRGLMLDASQRVLLIDKSTKGNASQTKNSMTKITAAVLAKPVPAHWQTKMNKQGNKQTHQKVAILNTHNIRYINNRTVRTENKENKTLLLVMLLVFQGHCPPAPLRPGKTAPGRVREWQGDVFRSVV